MWMMGYNDGGEFNSNIQDSFSSHGRLRSLMPRPAAAPASTNPPCLFHGGDLLTLNHHLAAMTEQNKRELNTQQVVVSSRWNPTPEQLQALEELYRQGTRTPSAEQIQHITSELRRYGKIEGKNVFYWFQNHKARERQKRRRQLESPPKEQLHNTNNGEKKESLTGANKTVHEVEQTKYWASPTNSSTLAPEKTASKAAGEPSECKADGWAQFDDHHDAELQQHRKNATWQMMNLSCSSSSSTNPIINSSPVTLPTIPSILPAMDLINPIIKPPYNLVNIFLEPYNPENLNETPHLDEDAQTLQLFPLISGGSRLHVNNDEKEEEDDSALNSTNGNPNYQFFEFLPLKN